MRRDGVDNSIINVRIASCSKHYLKNINLDFDQKGFLSTFSRATLVWVIYAFVMRSDSSVTRNGPWESLSASINLS